MVRGGEPLLPMASAPFKVYPLAPYWVLVNPLSWLIWSLDFSVWLVSIVLPLQSLRCWHRRLQTFSSPAPDSREEDAASYRRRSAASWETGLTKGLSEDLQANASPVLDTAWALWTSAASRYAELRCMGTRQFLGMHEGDGLPKRIFSDTTWLNYQQVNYRALCFGSGLRALGLLPLPTGASFDNANGDHSILIFEDTCAEWTTSLLGAFSQSLVVATSYATLGIDSVLESAIECGVAALVCNYADVQRVATPLAKCQTLKAIIYTFHYVAPEKKGIRPPGAEQASAQVLSFEEVIQIGRDQLNQFPASSPSPSSVAVVMYTSGSTGKPKGVVITHGNIAASVSALSEMNVARTGQEIYLAYLPAAHILELCAELMVLSHGGALGFADPKTITSKGGCRMMPDGSISTKPSLDHAPGAIQEFKPTIMAGVPLIWDTMKKAIEEQVGASSSVKRYIFQMAYSAQHAAIRTGRTCPLLNFVVFKKLAAMTGGRLRVAITGGGPISSETQSFIRVALGCSVLQGYALTETTCAGAIQLPFDDDDCVIGPPLSSVEVKLRSCTGRDEPLDREGRPYLATDTDHYGARCCGRGEVMIRGPSVSLGYFRREELTREAFQADGWFRSGDIGIWDSRGRLCIVDRIKNLVKLRGGEYIAIENMEKEYQTCALVNGLNGGVMCYGDGEMTRPVALVQVNLPELKKWADAQGVQYISLEELCMNREAEAMVLKALQAAACSRLSANEKIVGVKLIPGTGPANLATETSPWTPENGLQTASKKLNRKPIQATLKSAMAELKQQTAR